jgi:hypothetical protein
MPAVPFQTREDGRVVLLRPKFTSQAFQWLQRFLAKPQWKVRLDEVGSCLWLHMDGTRNFRQLCAILESRFGERVHPVDARTWALLAQLYEGRFITLGKP